MSWVLSRPDRPPSATRWSDTGLAELMLAHGASSFLTLWTGVAVMLAESGGDDGAIGGPTKSGQASDGSFDVGLWQINGYWHRLWYEHLAMSYARAFDAVQATAYARKISDQWQSFRPWNAFLNESHLKFEARAKAAAEAILSPIRLRADLRFAA